jgi:DNA-binding Xre family transcriptional regulator
MSRINNTWNKKMYSYTIAPIRQKFSESKLTYRELAESTGISTSQVHRLMTVNDAIPRLDHLVILCNALGVSPRNLFPYEK